MADTNYKLEGYTGADIQDLFNFVHNHRDHITYGRQLSDNNRDGVIAINGSNVYLNNVTLAGAYVFPNATTLYNGPTTSSWGPTGLFVDEVTKWDGVGSGEVSILRQTIFKVETQSTINEIYIRFRKPSGENPWTNWKKVADGAALDELESESIHFIRQLTNADYFDDLKTPGVYFWTGTGADNVPKTNETTTGPTIHPGLLIVAANSDGTRRAQIIINAQSTMFVRHGRGVPSNPVWSDWTISASTSYVDDKCDEVESAAIHYVGILHSTDDFNSLSNCGIYHWGLNDVPAHGPSTIREGVLIVASNNVSRKCQIIINALGSMFVRYGDNSAGWMEDWITIASKAYVDSVVENVFKYQKFIYGTTPSSQNNKDDLNDITESGIYPSNGNYPPGHSPTVRKHLTSVFSNPAGTYSAQAAMDDWGQLWFRSKIADGLWTMWKKADAAQNVDSFIFGPWTTDGVDSSSGRTREGYRDVPPNNAVEIAYRKAHQVADIEWTALGTVYTYKQSGAIEPGPSRDDTQPTFPAGTESSGIPYSSVNEYKSFVPNMVSLRTYMTASQNPHSVLYTETLSHIPETGETDHRRSSYGFVYDSLKAVSIGPYYGTHCTGFAAYIFDMPIYLSAQYSYLESIGKVRRISKRDINHIRLMDIMWRPGHVAMITDIYRDSRGVPQWVYVTEASSYHVHTSKYSASAFNDRLRNESGGKLYRYWNLIDDFSYEESPYVWVEYDSQSTPPEPNEDICTYRGDYATIRPGFPMYINYKKSDYTKMIVSKDGSTVGTYNLPSVYQDDTQSINITSSCNDPGQYLVYLTDDVNDSDPTYFEVIDTTTTAQKTDDKGHARVTFNAAANPKYIDIINHNGLVFGVYEITTFDKRLGYVDLDYRFMIESQNDDSSSYSPMHPSKGGWNGVKSDLYARVIYTGTYGSTTSDRIDISVT